jgi:5-hydroxyisourate hydrolase
MSRVTTHILDLMRGRPAAGVAVVLEEKKQAEFREIGRGSTDDDGRLKSLVPDGLSLEAGVFRIRFDTGAYFAKLGGDTFYPEVSIVFQIKDASQHYHVPLLLSAFGYSTYRGS